MPTFRRKKNTHKIYTWRWEHVPNGRHLFFFLLVIIWTVEKICNLQSGWLIFCVTLVVRCRCCCSCWREFACCDFIKTTHLLDEWGRSFSREGVGEGRRRGATARESTVLRRNKGSNANATDRKNRRTVIFRSSISLEQKWRDRQTYNYPSINKRDGVNSFNRVKNKSP